MKSERVSADHGAGHLRLFISEILGAASDIAPDTEKINDRRSLSLFLALSRSRCTLDVWRTTKANPARFFILFFIKFFFLDAGAIIGVTLRRRVFEERVK